MNLEEEKQKIENYYLEEFEKIKEKLHTAENVSEYHSHVENFFYDWQLKYIKISNDLDEIYYEKYIELIKKIDLDKYDIKNETSYIEKCVTLLDEYKIVKFEMDMIGYINNFLANKLGKL